MSHQARGHSLTHADTSVLDTAAMLDLHATHGGSDR